MNMKLHEWIKQTIDDTSGLTQKGLAEATGMNPATVNRMLYGRRHIRAAEVPLIEKYLGKKYEALSDITTEYTQPSHGTRHAFSDVMPVPSFGGAQSVHTDIPVYQCHENDSHDALMLDKGQIVDWVARHPRQNGNGSAFAIYITTNMFEPRYYTGELVYIHAGRPPVIAQDCCVKKQNGAVLLCRYMGQVGENIQLTDLHSGTSLELPKADVQSLYAIVGRG